MKANSKLNAADAMGTESTVSLIMGASAADPRDGEHCCVDGHTDTFRTRTVLVVAVESEQSTQFDKLDSVRCHAHVVFMPRSSHVFTPVSAPLNALRAASSGDVPLGTSPSVPFAKLQIGSCIHQTQN
jgi:hypothetical protein